MGVLWGSPLGLFGYVVNLKTQFLSEVVLNGPKRVILRGFFIATNSLEVFGM